jgi:hypothetical protein
MPEPSKINATASILAKHVGNRSHTTVSLDEISRQLGVGNPAGASKMLDQLEDTLLDQFEIECYPHLADDPGPQNIRLYRVGTLAHRRMKMFTEPSQFEDPELANDMKKIRGAWNWGFRPQSGSRPHWSEGDDQGETPVAS